MCPVADDAQTKLAKTLAEAVVKAERMRSVDTLTLQWRHEGGAARAERNRRVLATLPSNGAWFGYYALVFDEARDCLTYIASTANDDFGVAWRWNGSSWEPSCTEAVALGGAISQSFRAFSDPERDRIVCYGLVDNGDGQHRTVGVEIRDGAARLIEQDGDVPVGPPVESKDFRVVFGYDPERDTVVALGRAPVWERCGDDPWRRVQDVDPELTSEQQWHGLFGSVYDAQSKRVVWYWHDERGLYFRLLAWDGADLSELSLAGLPYANGGLHAARIQAVLLMHPEWGMTLLTDRGADRVVFLDGDVWRKADADFAKPPEFVTVQATYDRARQRIAIGPGTHFGPRGVEKHDRVFYEVGVELVRYGPETVGTGSADSPRLLCAEPGGVLELGDDWTTRRYAGDVTVVAVAQPRLPPPIAFSIGRDGLPYAVARNGDLYVWRDDAWTKAIDESPLLGSQGARLTAEHSPNKMLVFDTSLNALTGFSGSRAAVLGPNGWMALRSRGLSHTTTPEWVWAHDPRTKETLGVSLRSGYIERFDVGHCTTVAHVGGIPDGINLVPADPERSLCADWVFDPMSRELTLYLDDALDERVTIELGTVFDHAAEVCAPRMQLAGFDSTGCPVIQDPMLRFSG